MTQVATHHPVKIMLRKSSSRNMEAESESEAMEEEEEMLLAELLPLDCSAVFLTQSRQPA